MITKPWCWIFIAGQIMEKQRQHAVTVRPHAVHLIADLGGFQLSNSLFAKLNGRVAAATAEQKINSSTSIRVQKTPQKTAKLMVGQLSVYGMCFPWTPTVFSIRGQLKTCLFCEDYFHFLCRRMAGWLEKWPMLCFTVFLIFFSFHCWLLYVHI